MWVPILISYAVFQPNDMYRFSGLLKEGQQLLLFKLSRSFAALKNSASRLSGTWGCNACAVRV